jgi:hypothetical protein
MTHSHGYLCIFVLYSAVFEPTPLAQYIRFTPTTPRSDNQPVLKKYLGAQNS